VSVGWNEIKRQTDRQTDSELPARCASSAVRCPGEREVDIAGQ